MLDAATLRVSRAPIMSELIRYRYNTMAEDTPGSENGGSFLNMAKTSTRKLSSND